MATAAEEVDGASPEEVEQEQERSLGQLARTTEEPLDGPPVAWGEAEEEVGTPGMRTGQQPLINSAEVEEELEAEVGRTSSASGLGSRLLPPRLHPHLERRNRRRKEEGGGAAKEGENHPGESEMYDGLSLLADRIRAMCHKTCLVLLFLPPDVTSSRLFKTLFSYFLCDEKVYPSAVFTNLFLRDCAT